MNAIELTVQTVTDRQYPIHVGRGIMVEAVRSLASGFDEVCVITDETVQPLWARGVHEALRPGRQRCELVVVPSGEAAKTINVFESVLRALAESGFSRSGLLVNVGGGAVSDLGGYVASSYMRGIAFLNVATTLEAMVDAAVGGKTAVNLGTYKNYVGAFCEPRAVVCDLEALSTLAPRAVVAAWAEVLKHGLIADAGLFQSALQGPPRDVTNDAIVHAVVRSCEIKRDIVQRDFTEGGLRKLLNFGHTVGHAIESLSYARTPAQHLLHGEAVGMGLLAEAEISAAVGYLTWDERDKVRSAVLKAGLPLRPKFRIELSDFHQLIGRDKKNTGAQVRWTLIGPIGSARYNELVPMDVVDAALTEVGFV